MIGYIYKISYIGDEDIEINYVGSTMKTIQHRWHTHLSDYFRYLNESFQEVAIFPYLKQYGINNFKIILIKEYEVIDKYHLRAFEQLHINKVKCINKYASFQPLQKNKNLHNIRSKKFRETFPDIKKACDKNYYENNKANILARNKEYRDEHKEELAEQNKVYRQLNDEKIKANKKEYHQANAEKICAKTRAYYAANREEQLKKKKEYRESKKEELREKNKQYREANKEKQKAKAAAYYLANSEKIKARVAANKAAKN
jgi:hypothetical protein